MKSLALVLVVAATACYEPDVGPPISIAIDSSPGLEDGPPALDDASIPISGCENKDSNPAVAVSFVANLRPLMTRSPGGCAPCHMGRMVSGLDLSSYQSMRRGGLNSGARVIVPTEPCNSILLQKISRTPPFGSRMPFNGPPYLSAEERQLWHDWVAEGAANN